MNSKPNTLNKKLKILLIEDDPGDAHLIRKMLIGSKSACFELEHFDRLSTGLEHLAQMEIDLILLDLNLPDSQGLDTFVKAHAKAQVIPVIVLTGLEDENLAVKSISKGVQDYLVKGQIDSGLLIRAIHYAVERHRLRLKLKKANQKILEQQKELIDEERLKVLLQMAGATAHELNQPLMVLLGNIELLEMYKSDPEKLSDCVTAIEDAGNRISDIVKKIETIRSYETKAYPDGSEIISIDQGLKILSIEDDKIYFSMLKKMLNNLGMTEVSQAMNIKEAKTLLTKNTYALALLEYKLPDGDAFDLLGFMKGQDIQVPVVVLTGQGNEAIASKAIQTGAYDYLSKENINESSLSRSINTALERFRLNREINMAMTKMAEMSTTDELTGLYNRRYFTEALGREIARAKRYGTSLVMCMMDLDYFKRVNDVYGHTAGDMVLSEIGKILKDCIRQNDLACRYGGEEFAVILPNTDVKRAKAVCERFRKIVAGYPFKHNLSQFNITISMGITSYNSFMDQSPIEILELADKALYQAKEAGRNQLVEYTPSI
jgi:two-component system, cell cycle response regulator